MVEKNSGGMRRRQRIRITGTVTAMHCNGLEKCNEHILIDALLWETNRIQRKGSKFQSQVVFLRWRGRKTIWGWELLEHSQRWLGKIATNSDRCTSVRTNQNSKEGLKTQMSDGCPVLKGSKGEEETTKDKGSYRSLSNAFGNQLTEHILIHI